MSEAANPYQAPKTELDPGLQAEAGEALPTAGLGARFLNFIIDTIISRFVLVGVIVLPLKLVDLGEWREVVSVVVVLAAIGAYYVVLESAFGWTIGKLITGTRVVRFDGDRPNVVQIMGRTFVRFVPFEPFSLLFGSSAQGWHDSWSGTRVVRVRR
jgi:uncharacterized RDD family membrane protein YckC